MNRSTFSGIILKYRATDKGQEIRCLCVLYGDAETVTDGITGRVSDFVGHYCRANREEVSGLVIRSISTNAAVIEHQGLDPADTRTTLIRVVADGYRLRERSEGRELFIQNGDIELSRRDVSSRILRGVGNHCGSSDEEITGVVTGDQRLNRAVVGRGRLNPGDVRST